MLRTDVQTIHESLQVRGTTIITEVGKFSAFLPHHTSLYHRSSTMLTFLREEGTYKVRSADSNSGRAC
jgi:hypothetical protein